MKADDFIAGLVYRGMNAGEPSSFRMLIVATQDDPHDAEYLNVYFLPLINVEGHPYLEPRLEVWSARRDIEWEYIEERTICSPHEPNP